MTDFEQIKIVIVKPDGRESGELIIDLPDPKLAADQKAKTDAAFAEMRTLAQQNPDMAIKNFAAYVFDGATEATEMLYALRQEGLAKRAFENLSQIADMHHDARMKFYSIWKEKGHHLRREVGDDFILIDALKRVLPVYIGQAVRLYRGEAEKEFSTGNIGLSWTSDKSSAEIFAGGWNCLEPSGGVLIEAIAPIEAIIAGPIIDGVTGWECEYVVDRRRLGNIKALKLFPLPQR